MKDRVRLEAEYPHSPERVWKALTDSDALSSWLMPTDFKPLIGFRFRLERPDGKLVRGRVIEVSEGRQLAYTWDDEDEGQSVVVWTLTPKDGGTEVRIEHRAVEQPAVTCLGTDTYFNWMYALRHSLPGMLQLLRAFDGRSPRPPIVYMDETVETKAKQKVGR